MEGRDQEYPKAKSVVSGIRVRLPVPNMSSIASSLSSWDELDGIRELPIKGWNAAPHDTFYAANDIKKAKALAETIRKNGWVNPLIVVVRSNGEPYILEGLHRLVALHTLGVSSFPALVVIDKS